MSAGPKPIGRSDATAMTPDENQVIDTMLATSRAYRAQLKARGEARCRRQELLLMWRAASARAGSPVPSSTTSAAVGAADAR